MSRARRQAYPLMYLRQRLQQKTPCKLSLTPGINGVSIHSARQHSTNTPSTTPDPSSSSPAPASAHATCPAPRLRFAPSPTGYLHLGGLRTALFNHLLARKWKGKWILRIEDTDQTRFVPGAVDSLQNALEWSGLEWDEGPSCSSRSGQGDVGPYVQSERLDIYGSYTKKLLEEDRAYRCFCTPDQLAVIRETQKQKKATTSYDGRCRHLTEEEVVRKRKAGEKFVVRYKSNGQQLRMPPDLIFGEYSMSAPAPSSSSSTSTSTSTSSSSLDPSSSSAWSRPSAVSPLFPCTSTGKGTNGPGSFQNSTQHSGGGQNGALGFTDDFILIKSDGWPTYHFANVIDDHLMGITHVLRGEEWLPSTVKHIQLYDAFGFTPPDFAHLPLLINADGTKLSKRTGDVRVEHYRDAGYEPSALINFVALMGWDHHVHEGDHGNTTTPTLHRSPFFPNHRKLPSLSSAELRKDLNSETELYTMDGLIEAFELERIVHRRAAVFMPKLDWLNKMHLRRQGMVIDSGESNGEPAQSPPERNSLIDRLMKLLRESKVLASSPLIHDKSYVSLVLDAELPRAVLLNDIPRQSIFFFLDPDLNNHEAVSMLEKGKGNKKLYRNVMRYTLERLQEGANIDTEDNVWELIHQITEGVNAQRRSEVVTPLRHALTGRKAGPSLPALIVILGRERSIQRIDKALARVEELIAEKEEQGLKEESK